MRSMPCSLSHSSQLQATDTRSPLRLYRKLPESQQCSKPSRSTQQFKACCLRSYISTSRAQFQECSPGQKKQSSQKEMLWSCGFERGKGGSSTLSMLPRVPTDGSCFSFASSLPSTAVNFYSAFLTKLACWSLRAARRVPKHLTTPSASHSVFSCISIRDSSANSTSRESLFCKSSIFPWICPSNWASFCFSLLDSFRAASNLLIYRFFSWICSAFLWSCCCRSSILPSQSLRESRYSLFRFSNNCWKCIMSCCWEALLNCSLCPSCVKVPRLLGQTVGNVCLFGYPSCLWGRHCCAWKVRLNFLCDGTRCIST